MLSDPPFVWVITGCSSGIGHNLVLAALKRGDKVIATTRAQSFSTLEDFKQLGADILELDVTVHIEELKKIAAEAVKIHGHVDILVNNAGFAMCGSLEELTTEDLVNQFNTNVFGAMNVSRAFLPYMRERKKGDVVFIGSIYGWSVVPFAGAYAASKFALRGMSETLNDEIAPFGLRSICFDLGWFRTPILVKRSGRKSTIEAYNDSGEEADKILMRYHGHQDGDPVRCANIIIDVIKSEGQAKGKEIPHNLFVGSDCYEMVKSQCENALDRLESWKEVAFSTDYPA